MEREIENTAEDTVSPVPADEVPVQAPSKRLRQDEKNNDLRRELDKIVNEISAERIAGLVALSSASKLKKVFNDGELMRTALSFIDNSLNISAAARSLYMHRNTMMYRLEKIKRLTGLNIKRFDDALAFKILYKAFRRREEEL